MKKIISLASVIALSTLSQVSVAAEDTAAKPKHEMKMDHDMGETGKMGSMGQGKMGDMDHGSQESRMDLQAALPMLLPLAITWAEAQAAAAAHSGIALNDHWLAVARSVGVVRPELIRLAFVHSLPMPQDPMLNAAAVQTGLISPGMKGLTLGYSVFVLHGHDTVRLLSHQFRHVYQYEQAGSIAAFLPGYLEQLVQFGHANAPFEQDARAHERDVP